MSTDAMQSWSTEPVQRRVRARRPDHPEDYGRGPWWRLAELFFLGFIFPSPPAVTRLWPEDDDEPGS